MPVVVSLAVACDALRATTARVQGRHPDWKPDWDARLTVFSKCLNVLNSTRLLLFVLEELLPSSSWVDSDDNVCADDHQIGLHVLGLEMHVRVSFFQLYFSAIESSFRQFLRALDPIAASDGRAEFKAVYKALLCRLLLQEHEGVLDLCRELRNTIHNGGIFLPRRDQNITFSYRGKMYTLEVGQPIAFVDWFLLLQLAADLAAVAEAVVTAPQVVSIPELPDILIGSTTAA